MKEIDRLINYYNDMTYSFLNDFLLFSNDIDRDLKNFHNSIVTKEFLECFKIFLKKLSDGIYYPKETFKNTSRILDYIEENSTNLEQELNDCFEILENIVIFSDEKYLAEFETKNNCLEDYQASEYHIWKKEDIKESIRFDYFVLLSFNVSSDSYIENYLSSFILNRNYIYALKKIIYACPDVLKIENFKNRALEVLKQDLELLEDCDMKTIKMYITKNYHPAESISFHITELERFKKEIKSVLHEIKHLNLNPFDIGEFKSYYELLKLEHYLYFDDKIDIHSVSLDEIYKLIEENSKKSTIHNKAKLLDLLNAKKNLANSAQEYNYYLVMLNGMDEVNKLNSISDQFTERSNQSDYIKGVIRCKLKNDSSLYQKLYESKKYDLGNFESFLVSDPDFESKKEHLKDTKYPISIKLFLNECPSMFMDPIVYNRTIEILKSYDDNYSKQMIKKLEKMMKR